MLLIIGLGNPGEKYKKTRHNAGFIIIEELRKKWNFPEFKFTKKFNSELSKEKLSLSSPFSKGRVREGFLSRLFHQTNKNDIILAKPQTFMNRSGETVREIMNFYKLTLENIIVVHDDLDIEIGKYKISANSSSAGHKGVQSIINNLGTQKFKRIRIGVEKIGGRKKRGNISGNKFVLQNFKEEEIKKVKNLAEGIEFDLIV